jgi:hypothetical protein
MDSIDKKGITTTEFWVGNVIVPVVVPVLMVFINKYGIPLDATAVTAIVIAAVTSPITYILGRIFNKKQVANVVIATQKTETAKLEVQKLQLEAENAK